MTHAELKLARTIAQDSSIDLSQADDDPMYGCGCAGFVELRAVAKFMRWQCQRMDGSWDEKQYNEDLPVLRRKIMLADLTSDDVRRWLTHLLTHRLLTPHEPFQIAA